MPINNESKISLEFTYEFPLPNNQDGQGILFPLRFHHTEDMGAVVTFLDKDGKPTDVQLPAVMFAEVSEFLQAKGVIEGRFHQHHSPLPQPMVVSSGTRLGVPTISRQPMSPKEQQIRRAATPIDVENEEPSPEETQTFIPSGIQEGLESIADVDPVQNFERVSSERGKEAQAEPPKESRKPRVAAQRTKLSVAQIKEARSTVNTAKRIKPLE